MENAPATSELIDLLRNADEKTVRQRLDEIQGEEAALRTLLRLLTGTGPCSATHSPGGAAEMSNTLSVRDLCERYAVTEHTVLGWIRTGELRAINVGRRLGAKKPRWRVTEEALTAWEQRRTPTPPLPRAKRRKRPAEVIEFYK